MDFTIFENPERLSEDEICVRYPNCKFLLRVDEPLDRVGELLAVCGNPKQNAEYYDYYGRVSKDSLVVDGGWYTKECLNVLY